MIRIVARHFVAGVVLQRRPAGADSTLSGDVLGLAVRAAPIVGYMAGWDGTRVIDYCVRKRWRWELIP
jgi:hypothetical protein